MFLKVWTACASLALVLQGCASTGATEGLPSQSTLSAGAAASAAQSLSADSVASAVKAHVNLAALPLDDYHYSTSPKVGWIYSCQQTFNGGGAQGTPPWIDTATKTFDLLKKAAVEGSVTWESRLTSAISGSSRTLDGNGLPSHTTGVFPISPSDPAYKYDQNPNSIQIQNVADSIPADPAVAAKPSCVGLGPVGVMLTGAQLYNGFDALGRDAAAHEVLDKCGGHPDQSGTYHYHMVSACMKDPGTGHSNLLGYAIDGFGIYGVRGEGGTVLASANLDACHGHTHAIVWNGKTVVMYHYHMTYDFPYSIGCYRGTPAMTRPGP